MPELWQSDELPTHLLLRLRGGAGYAGALIRLEALEAVARIDARIRDWLLMRARKHGVTEAEAIELTEVWKRASRKTKPLHLVDGRHKRQ